MSQSPKPTASPTFADVERALLAAKSLSSTRRRDLRSAVARVAALLGSEPAHLPLELERIAARLAAINPVAVGMTAKTLANVRSDFLAAVRQSDLRPVLASSAKADLSVAWAALMAQLTAKRHRLGLSRLARYASAAGVAPTEIDDAAIERLIGEVRRGSLHHNPNVLHRNVATIWNEVVNILPNAGLATVTKPSFRGPPKRIAWESLTEEFRADVEEYLRWCEVVDLFAEDARPRRLAPRTLKLRRNQIQAAVTALVASGIAPESIKGLADLVATDNFRRILNQRLKAVDKKPNNFNRDLAEVLVQIAREWVKLDDTALAALNKLTAKMPTPKKGLTFKNKRAVRQFDDPAAVARLHDLPDRLWAEVRRDEAPNFRTLAKAQAALAIAMLTYIPVRLENLHELNFDTHIFLRDGARGISSLEIPADEVKNGETELAFDIPQHIAKKLIEYRERIAPKVIGHRPERLFVRADGKPKSQGMVAHLIRTYLRKRAGIELSPHQFRHVVAETILKDQPGAHEIVRQLLGHKNIKTTIGFYAGQNSRRAGLHHQRLIEEAIARSPAFHRRRKNKTTQSETER